MNKKEITEIKKRFKKDCSITRIAGCYVDSQKNKVTTLNEMFLNLDEEELFKYLDLAKKIFTGKVNDNILTLSFSSGEVGEKRQNALLGLRDSKLKKEDLLNAYYDQVIENYQQEGNYLILVYHDAYDVMKKGEDGRSQDESEEVFEYILGAVCPVTLAKPALGYRSDENEIGLRIRDWVVGMPTEGFLYPSFDDRTTNIHSCMVYSKDAMLPQKAWVENVLGCDIQLSASMQKQKFLDMVADIAEGDEEKEYVLLYELQGALRDKKEEQGDDDICLETSVLKDVLEGVEEDADTIENVCSKYAEVFQSDQKPMLSSVIDKKLVEEADKRRYIRELLKENESLKKTIEELRKKYSVEF